MERRRKGSVGTIKTQLNGKERKVALLKKTEEHKSESFHYEVDKSLKITSATTTIRDPYGRARPAPKTTQKKITIYFKDGKFDKVSALGSSVPNRQTWKLYKEIEAEISRIEEEISVRVKTKAIEISSEEKVLGSKMAGILKKSKSGKVNEDSI